MQGLEKILHLTEPFIQICQWKGNSPCMVFLHSFFFHSLFTTDRDRPFIKYFIYERSKHHFSVVVKALSSHEPFQACAKVWMIPSLSYNFWWVCYDNMAMNMNYCFYYTFNVHFSKRPQAWVPPFMFFISFYYNGISTKWEDQHKYSDPMIIKDDHGINLFTDDLLIFS